MGSKYPILAPEKVIKILKKLGFSEVSQKGSHLKLKRITKETDRNYTDA